MRLPLVEAAEQDRRTARTHTVQLKRTNSKIVARAHHLKQLPELWQRMCLLKIKELLKATAAVHFFGVASTSITVPQSAMADRSVDAERNKLEGSKNRSV